MAVSGHGWLRISIPRFEILSIGKIYRRAKKNPLKRTGGKADENCSK
jgi:hypothetical protein